MKEKQNKALPKSNKEVINEMDQKCHFCGKNEVDTSSPLIWTSPYKRSYYNCVPFISDTQFCEPICFKCASDLYFVNDINKKGYSKMIFDLHNKLCPKIMDLQGRIAFNVIYYKEYKFGNCPQIDFWFYGPDKKIWYGKHMGINLIVHCRKTNLSEKDVSKKFKK